MAQASLEFTILQPQPLSDRMTGVATETTKVDLLSPYYRAASHHPVPFRKDLGCCLAHEGMPLKMIVFDLHHV